jgi:uncharacterized SAM-binding protein YcdF (DUF218 family)
VAKAMGLILMPPALLLVLAVAALALARRRPRSAWWLGAAVVVMGYLLSIRPVAEALLRPLEGAYPPLTLVDGVGGIPKDAEAIVVLSGGQLAASPALDGGSALGDSSLRRISYAARLAKRAPDLPVYTTGDLPLPGGQPTGALMATRLSEGFGIAAERITAETGASNTAGHAPKLKPLLGDRRTVVLITTAWHMPRAVGVFRAHGFDPIPAPTDYQVDHGRPLHFLDLLPSADSLSDSADAFHEYLGLTWYAIRGELG